MITQNALPAAIVTFFVTVAFILVLRPIVLETRLVDRPGGRKQHVGAVPVIGGIAMFIGVLAGLVVLGESNSFILGGTFSLFLLVLVGVIDDVADVPAPVRVLIQVSALIITAFAAGLMLFSLGNPFGFGEILLGPFALVGTLMVGITVINSYNLVDGADGLAGTLAFIPFVAVSVLGVAGEMPTVLAGIMAACTLAYLVFNFPLHINRPIRTFMGDAGSTMLGFSVFWLVLGISQGEGARITPVAGLWLASIPVYDSLTCFVRRIYKGNSPFRPGRDHFHHTLQRGGLGTRQKLAVLAGLQGIYAVVGVAGSLAGVPDVVLFVAWSVLGLTQRSVLKRIAKRHRAYLFRKLRAGELDPERAARIRVLR
jgi:UDP-GlcNAc:undecaprenyl-phosphate GlcNAc-1-phosphate transferase